MSVPASECGKQSHSTLHVRMSRLLVGHVSKAERGIVGAHIKDALLLITNIHMIHSGETKASNFDLMLALEHFCTFAMAL